MKLVRVYNDGQGETHFDEAEVPLAAVTFAPPAPPVNLSAWWLASRYGFMGAPPGWDGNWHPAPQRLVTVYMAGEVEVTVSDGEARRFAPGDVVLAEDTVGKGHRSRVVGTADALLAVVLLPD